MPTLVTLPDSTQLLTLPASLQASPSPNETPQSPPETGRPRRCWERILLGVSLAVAAITHGFHLFLYPLYTTDEGIYVEQAWSVLREHRLSPYTYFYDHAPGGWLAIAGWVGLLPGQFQTLGNGINSGRALMLLVHLASVYLLFRVTRRFSGSLVAAFIASFLFSVSPLGVAVITKENAIFFAPVILYLVYRQVRERTNQRFALGFWSFFVLAPVSVYTLYASLKNELFPSHLNFDINNPPADHVSLLYTIWWQMHRSKGSILDPQSLFWQFSLGRWLPKDHFLLIAGAVAMLINLLIGWRRRHLGLLVTSLLGLSYTLYLVRGSLMLEFYVLPLLPFLAMNLGMLAAELVRWMPRAGQAVAAAALVVALILPVGGYVLVHNTSGRLALHDLYTLPLTDMQTQQVAYVRQHVPANSRIIMDDDLWVALHDVKPYYRFAHSHWKAASDPDVRDKLFGKDWQKVDYIVMSNKMLEAMQQNDADHSEDWILDAVNHADRVWDLQRGDVEVSVYKVGAGG
jgi:hypothetical protein